MPRGGGRALKAAILLPVAASVLGGCVRRLGFEAPPLRVTSPEAAAYDALFPNYLRYCAASRIARRGDRPGGAAGHAVMFVSGVALDSTAAYPRLRVAAGGSGVGISVDRMVTNVNWVGVPGAVLFFDGITGTPNDTVDIADVARTADALLATGALRGVRGRLPDPDWKHTRPAAPGELATKMVGTDVGMRVARSLECVTMPVSPSMLAEAVSLLNRRNAEYAESGRPFEWHGLRNNCTHLGRNLLAGLTDGLVEPVAVNRHGVGELFNIVVPSNEIAVWLGVANGGPLGERDDVLAYYRNARWRRLLLEHGWLPHQPGVLLATQPQHAVRDSSYVPDDHLWTLDAGPLAHSGRREYSRAGRDPRVTELRANLAAFADRYRRSLRARRAPDAYHAKLPGAADRAAFDAFHARYYEYVEAALARVAVARARPDVETQ